MIVFFLFYSFSSLASDYDCARLHIEEAIEINRDHIKLYKDAYEDEAAKVLGRLIFIEKIMLPFSRSLDRSAKTLVDAGFAMWCEDFVSMDSLPQFQIRSSPPANKFKPVDKKKLKQMRKKIKSFEIKNAMKLYDEIVLMIETDLNDKSFNCVTRHFLESSARSLKLAVKRERYVPRELRQDFLKATKKMMKQMSLALMIARPLDNMAAKVQESGVPVLCQEMPHIPY